MEKDTLNKNAETEENDIQSLEENNSDSENIPETEEKSENDKYNEVYDRLQRTMAEFDNFRKRTIKEKASMYNDGVRDTVEKLLPVIDNFERAMSTVEKTEDSFYKGVEMILRQFLSMINDLGVEEIVALEQKFDPNLHFAVAHEDNENYAENVVIEVMQKGYKYKDKVIRHSMVKVAN